MEAICESPDEWRTYQEYEKNLDEELKEIEKSGQWLNTDIYQFYDCVLKASEGKWW